MLIKFHTVSWRNFLSTGNVPNVIYLDRSHTTLIGGKSGHGKSTLLDAITYALFGKAYRNCNIPQLINSINQKQLEVIIEFSIGKDVYRIVRGLKPKIFEIIKNGTLLNQEGDNRDYQKILENQILKLNYRTFRQVVVLGSSTFAPFMQLPAAQRREIVEDILDIRIFSIMNIILKDYIQKNKEEITFIDNKISVEMEKTKGQDRLLSTMLEHKEELINQYEDQLKSINNDILEKSSKIDEFNNKKEYQLKLLESEKDLSSDIKSIEKDLIQKESLIEIIDKERLFFNKDNCPSCKQNISHDHKEKIFAEFNNKKDKLYQDIKSNSVILESLISKNDNYLKLKNLYNDILNNISRDSHDIKKFNVMKSTIVKKIVDIKSSNNDIEEEKKKLKQYASNVVNFHNRRNELLDEDNYHSIMVQLLKDNGIKTKVIEQYLPVINKMINHYLNIFDFYVNFELDDTFNETIKARFKDTFSYELFSEGQKKKIDISLLLAFRDVAKLKNSVNTNLLIMDEVADSSLDAEGLENLMDVINKLENTNVFVISHRSEQLLDKFQSHIKFELKNEYSIII